MSTPYCLGFCFSPDMDGEMYVALIKKTKPTWQAGKLNGIGGKIEPGEMSVNGMVREFREETGWNLYGGEWRMFARYRVTGAMLYCYATIIPFCDFQQIKTTTEERVIRIPVRELYLWERLDNLDWLIPMARVSLRLPGSTCFNIDE